MRFCFSVTYGQLVAVTADVRSGSHDAALVPLWGSVGLPAGGWSAAAVLATTDGVGRTVGHARRTVRGADAQVWDVVLSRPGGRTATARTANPVLPVAADAGAGRAPARPAGGATADRRLLGGGLAFAAALHHLVLLETGDGPSARRAAWLIQLVPGANALVLGYTEALAGLLAVVFFTLLRTRRNLAGAIPVGVLCGLARPTGLLLSLPALIELARPGRNRPDRSLAGLTRQRGKGRPVAAACARSGRAGGRHGGLPGLVLVRVRGRPCAVPGADRAELRGRNPRRRFAVPRAHLGRRLPVAVGARVAGCCRRPAVGLREAVAGVLHGVVGVRRSCRRDRVQLHSLRATSPQSSRSPWRRLWSVAAGWSGGPCCWPVSPRSPGCRTST